MAEIREIYSVSEENKDLVEIARISLESVFGTSPLHQNLFAVEPLNSGSTAKFMFNIQTNRWIQARFIFKRISIKILGTFYHKSLVLVKEEWIF